MIIETMKKHKYIIVILAVALLIRVASVLATAINNPSAFMRPDSHEHKRLALTNPMALNTQRMPGYPMIVKMVYTLCGEDRLLHSFREFPLNITVALIQCIFGTITVLFIFLLLQRQAPLAAHVAAGLYAVEPLALGYCIPMLSDNPFTLFWIAGFYFLSRGLNAKRLLE